MTTKDDVKVLLDNTDKYHNALIEQARSLSRFREIVAFLSRCLDFMERHLPEQAWRPWLDASKAIPHLLDQGSVTFLSIASDEPQSVHPVVASGSSATSDAFSFITEHVNYLEDAASRQDYADLALSYRTLLAGPDQQREVILYFAPTNTVFLEKFGHSIASLHALPREEDPQGPLLEMRSAIDIALDTLIKLTPLTRRERGDLKQASVIPTIAQHFARNDIAKMDLILSNERFQKLMRRLSATKEVKLGRDHAENLMAEAIALLHLMASTLAPMQPEPVDQAPPPETA
jgi:hypothetical protein